MIKAQKKAARLLAQRKTAKHKVQPYDTTGAGNRQAHIYAPAPGEIAYVAYHENKQRGLWEITISPRRCSKWGIWYARSLPGRYAMANLAQDALDNMADEQGWRIISA